MPWPWQRNGPGYGPRIIPEIGKKYRVARVILPHGKTVPNFETLFAVCEVPINCIIELYNDQGQMANLGWGGLVRNNSNIVFGIEYHGKAVRGCLLVEDGEIYAIIFNIIRQPLF